MRAVGFIRVTQVAASELSFELNYVEEKKKISQKASSSTLQVSCQATGTALWSADVTLSISAQAQIARVQAHHIPHIVGDRWSVPHQGRGRGWGRSGVLWDRSRKNTFVFFVFFVFQCKNAPVFEQMHARACDWPWGWVDEEIRVGGGGCGGGVPAHMIPQRCEAINSL